MESKFQYKNPKITFFCVERNEEFDKNKFDNFSIGSSVKKTIIEKDKEAEVELYLKIGEKSDKYPFCVEARIQSFFKNDGMDNFDRLLEINAPAMLLSHIRPIVSLMTSQMGFPPFYIPFMNFTNAE